MGLRNHEFQIHRTHLINAIAKIIPQEKVRRWVSPSNPIYLLPLHTEEDLVDCGIGSLLPFHPGGNVFVIIPTETERIWWKSTLLLTIMIAGKMRRPA